MGFMFFLFVLVAIGAIAFSLHQGKKVDESWSNVARRLRLNFQPGSLMLDRYMTGTIDGFGIAVQTITRGSGKHSSKYTMYRLTFPQTLPARFSVTKQGFVSGITKAFGAQDIEVGDPMFDNLFMIKGRNPSEVISFLTRERRRAIQIHTPLLDGLSIDQVSISSESRGMQSSENILIGTIQRMLELAQAMVGSEVSERSASNGPLLMRKTPMPSHVTPPPMPQQPTPPPYPSGDVEDESISNIEGIAAPLPVTKNVLADIPSISEIAEILFSQNSSLSEADKKFSADYKGKIVGGHGILRAWSASSFDFVFGSGNYAKATVELPLSITPMNRRGSFQVLVKLSSETVRGEIGKEFSFVGELVKADGFTRQIYIDATSGA